MAVTRGVQSSELHSTERATASWLKLALAPLRLQFHRLLYEYASEGLKLGTMTELSRSSLPDQPEELTTSALGVNLNYRWVVSDDWIVDSGLQSKLSFDDVDVNQAVVDAIAAQYVDERPRIRTGR